MLRTHNHILLGRLQQKHTLTERNAVTRETLEARSRFGGILISRGASVRIPKDGLRISLGPDGKITGEPLRLEISLNFVGHWMRVALAQLGFCEDARNRHLAVEEKDGAVIGPHLEDECVAGMVAIMAAATAIDAFYAALKDRSPRVASIPVSRTGRSSRHRIVAEAIRREFRVGPNSQANVRLGLRELYKFRDWSVHPSAAFSAPVRHPDVPSLVEWRYAAFRFENSQKAVRVALSMLVQLPPLLRDKDSVVGKHVLGTQGTVDELAHDWRLRFGALLETDTPADSAPAEQPGR